MAMSVNRRMMLTVSGAGLVSATWPLAKSRAENAPAASPPSRPAIEIFARSARVSNIALSPDGKRIALVVRKGDDGYLIYFDVGDKGSKGINIGPTKVRDIFWGDNNNVVLVNSVTTVLPEFVSYKNEFKTARIINLTTQKVKILFDREVHYYRLVIDSPKRVKINGEYRVVAANYEMQEEFPLCLYSFGMDTTQGHLMLKGDHDTRAFVVNGAGQIVAYSNFDEELKTWELFFNTALATDGLSLKKVYHLKGEVLNIPELVGIGRDGNSVVLLVDDDYHEIGASGLLSASLNPDSAGKAYSPLFHPTSGCLAGFSQHDDWISLSYFDPILKKLSDALPDVVGTGTRFSIASFAEDPRKMLVYTEDKGDAGSYWFYDLSNGTAEPVTTNFPDLPSEWITQKQAIDYQAGDGLNIHAYLTLPPFREARNLPLIVMPHGGPEARDYIDFDWKTQALASLGYAVLQPNFRGSTGYGQDFTDAGHGEWGRKMQSDLSDGVRYLAGKGIIDPKRVAIFGASYGGYAALAGATLDTGIYKCAVSVAGISDLKEMINFGIENSAVNNSHLVLTMKLMMGDPRHYDEISPAKQAARCDCPVLLIHGADDTVVPIDQSQRMERALKAAGKDVQFITYKGQDHWEDIPSARIAMMQAIADFLQTHNPA